MGLGRGRNQARLRTPVKTKLSENREQRGEEQSDWSTENPSVKTRRTARPTPEAMFHVALVPRSTA